MTWHRLSRDDRAQLEIPEAETSSAYDCCPRCGLLVISSNAALADCKAEVDAAFSKLREGKGFRLETKIVNEQQGSLNMTVDYILPDRMHQASVSGFPTKMEMIAVGGKAWSNQGQGWAEVPANFAEVITKQMKETVAEPTKSTASYDCLGGSRSSRGRKYVAYRSALPLQAEEKAKSEAAAPEAKPGAGVRTVYVDKATGLPVRNVVTKADAADKRLFDGTFQCSV